ncbi:MAG: asparagine--tRNA ligase [Sphaerochaeta sp.]|nr:asparagine--tRNA ligase [Sphaerochaeta sp.]MCH3920974.1 asparagine--tRNA ligase [Sphaerochaeta sp.]MCI2045128.1 asparagine--tRNA ligase [Sphaerochaeta sp.]MCI2075858.1 asparagine--tRNA ligase [Sphaerochaeta sp.]MCI2097124.1 asparagine--tRNA ligase [Sphaerochaeta sp.]
MQTRIKTLLSREPGDEIVTAEGWVRTKRDSKNVCFLEVNDGSCLKGLQVVVDRTTFQNDALLSSITTGASVICKGKIVKSLGGVQPVEMQSNDIMLVGSCPNDYPLQKKFQTLEYLRDIAHLRSRTNTIGAVARVRNTLAYATHRFFQENGFVYVNTPIISASDAEGAGEQFTVTTLDLRNVPKTPEGNVDYSKDFFGKMAKLTVSGQLEGETYATSMKNIYTFGPTFRSENSVTKRHLAEFWMIEPEMAFCDIEGDMDVAQAYLKFLFKAALEENGEDLAFFEKRVEPNIIKTLTHVVETPFAHMTYTDAIKELVPHNAEFEFPVHWGSDIQTEHERFLTEQVCKSPVIVTDYPKEIKSFYMKQNDDGKTVRGMDVLVPRLGEIIGGSEREVDYDKLVARMNELHMKQDEYWWYLDLRKYGSVPHSGFGLGFERAVMYVTGMQNIRDVIPYPRAVGQAEF